MTWQVHVSFCNDRHRLSSTKSDSDFIRGDAIRWMLYNMPLNDMIPELYWCTYQLWVPTNCRSDTGQWTLCRVCACICMQTQVIHKTARSSQPWTGRPLTWCTLWTLFHYRCLCVIITLRYQNGLPYCRASTESIRSCSSFLASRLARFLVVSAQSILCLDKLACKAASEAA